MDLKQQQTLSSLLVTMLRNLPEDPDAKEARVVLNALTGFRKKLDTFGVDVNDIAVFDKSKGTATAAAANALQERDEYRRTLVDDFRAAERWKDMLLGLRKPETMSNAGIITASVGSATVGKTRQFIVRWLKEAGPAGMTQEEIETHDPLNDGIQRRLFALVETGAVFMVGQRYVHLSYRSHHPEAYREAEQARMDRLLELGQ